jgi:hypothetical protein
VTYLFKICSYIIKHHSTNIYARMDIRRIAPSTGQRWPVSFKPGQFTPDERARSPIGQRAGWTPEPVWMLLRRWNSLAHTANRVSTSRSPSRCPSNYTNWANSSQKNPFTRVLTWDQLQVARQTLWCSVWQVLCRGHWGKTCDYNPQKPCFYFWYKHNENLHDGPPPYSWHWIIFHLEFGFLTCYYGEGTETSVMDKGHDSPTDSTVSAYFCIV